MRSIDSMTDDVKKLGVKFALEDPQWGVELQQGLEEYMMSLYESVDADLDSPEADVETESGQPFCACNVCEGREILSYVVPRAIVGYLEGKVTLDGYPD